VGGGGGEGVTPVCRAAEKSEICNLPGLNSLYIYDNYIQYSFDIQMNVYVYN
jgi:hypothetical protein